MRMAHDAVNSAANLSVSADSVRGWRKIPRCLTLASLIVAVIALLLLAAGPLGWRAGWWHYRIAFSTLMPWSFYCAAAAVALAVIGLLTGMSTNRRRHMLMAVVGLVVGGAIAGVPLYYEHIRTGVPRINDISTDTENPPQFQAILPLRKAADANPLAYDAKTAEVQRKGYPDIAPIQTDLGPQAAFDRALATAGKLGWTIVASDPTAGRIEADQSSRWFGFTDDVAIRVAPAGSGSRVDIRSVARYGRGDFGVNAARVRSFVSAFREAGK
jgi:uncharacterized protein (DUF1499 family)